MAYARLCTFYLQNRLCPGKGDSAADASQEDSQQCISVTVLLECFTDCSTRVYQSCIIFWRGGGL